MKHLEKRVSRRKFIASSSTVFTGFAAPRQSGSMIRGFDHVALPMQNTDAMIAFYRGLGLQVTENATACSVYIGDQMINFHRPARWQDQTFTLRAPAAKPPCGDLCFVWDGTPQALKSMLDRGRKDHRRAGRAAGRTESRLFERLCSGSRRQSSGIHDLSTEMKTSRHCLLAILLAASPAFAQIDLSGEWSNITHEDSNHRTSVEIGDYTGLPINEAGRYKAESWDEAVLATHERQCIPHPVTYAMRGQPGNIRIGKIDDVDTGQILAYTIHGTYGRPRTIWMDGRAHPSPYAPHTWSGFSTGKWEQNALVVTTTHIKMGWIMRNGVPTSDQATMTERFIRHGNYLLDVIIVNDPVYLSEPFIRTQDWRLNLNGEPNAWGPCGPAQIADEIPNQKKGYVPHHLPGTNEQMKEFPRKRGVSPEAALGGAETMYPEYRFGVKRVASQTAVPAIDTKGFEVLPVQGNVYVLAGAGGNIAIQVGEDGVLLVDTGEASLSEKILAAIRQISNKPIRFIVNTNARPDHIGGNEFFAKLGSKVGGGLLVGGYAGDGAAVLAHEQVLKATHSVTDAYPGESKEIYTNGEGVELVHPSKAATNGDSIVYFRRSDVVVTGDIFSMTSYPVIDPEKGSFTGLLASLNRIIDITIPKDWQEGGTMVIPGHGRIADEADVVEYRDMITIIRDRIQDLIKKGMTLEQIKAARITRDYDGRYGDPTRLIESAYRDLK